MLQINRLGLEDSYPIKKLSDLINSSYDLTKNKPTTNHWPCDFLPSNNLPRQAFLQSTFMKAFHIASQPKINTT